MIRGRKWARSESDLYSILFRYNGFAIGFRYMSYADLLAILQAAFQPVIVNHDADVF